MRWVEIYTNEGDVNIHYRKQLAYKDANLSTTQIFRVIRYNNITLKLTISIDEPNKRFGKDIDINANIKNFQEQVKKYKIENIICYVPKNKTRKIKKNYK